MSPAAMPGRPSVAVYADAHAASVAVARGLVRAARRAVEARGRFSVALAGGSAPRQAYALLAEEPFRTEVPWEAVHLFWGDERCVPPGHPRSNYGMAARAFVSRVPVPPANVHRMPGERPPEEGAAAYARELAAFFGAGTPHFDLVHLGVGPDGHTASLFPFARSLRARDRAVTFALQLPAGEPRLTLTVPVLNAARRVEFLALGAGKAEVVRTVVAGARDPFRIPAQLVRPAEGELAWVLDRAAADRLPEGVGGPGTDQSPNGAGGETRGRGLPGE